MFEFSPGCQGGRQDPKQFLPKSKDNLRRASDVCLSSVLYCIGIFFLNPCLCFHKATYRECAIGRVISVLTTLHTQCSHQLMKVRALPDLMFETNFFLCCIIRSRHFNKKNKPFDKMIDLWSRNNEYFYCIHQKFSAIIPLPHLHQQCGCLP